MVREHARRFYFLFDDGFLFVPYTEIELEAVKT